MAPKKAGKPKPAPARKAAAQTVAATKKVAVKPKHEPKPDPKTTAKPDVRRGVAAQYWEQFKKPKPAKSEEPEPEKPHLGHAQAMVTNNDKDDDKCKNDAKDSQQQIPGHSPARTSSKFETHVQLQSVKLLHF